MGLLLGGGQAPPAREPVLGLPAAFEQSGRVHGQRQRQGSATTWLYDIRPVPALSGPQCLHLQNGYSPEP